MGSTSTTRLICSLLGLLFAAGCGASKQAASPTAVAARTPTTRETRWMTKHDQHVARARQGNISIVLLGDSITEGWYMPLFRQHLAPLNAANFGISADRTEHVLWRVQNGALDGYSARKIVLMIGTNNLKQGSVTYSPSDVAGGVRAILDEIQKRQPQAKVLLMSVLPRQPQVEQMAERVAQTNVLLKQLADGQRVQFVDLARDFVNDSGQIRTELYQKDLLHLSPQGYEVWLQRILPLLQSDPK